MSPFDGISGFIRKGKTTVGYCQDKDATAVPIGISWHAGYYIPQVLQLGKSVLSDSFSFLGVYVASPSTTKASPQGEVFGSDPVWFF